MRRPLLLPFLLSSCLTLAQAGQQPPTGPGNPTGNRPRADSTRGKSLTGRVFLEGGQPASDVSVLAQQVGAANVADLFRLLQLRSALTDADGSFNLDGLNPGRYRLSVFAPGYVLSDFDQTNYYRPGDHVVLQLVKGGVITGSVTDASSGAAVIGIQVRATMVRDVEGGRPRLWSGLDNEILALTRISDDRGRYRMFGLESGTYLVSTASGGAFPFLSAGAYGGAPSYHPSGSRASAAEVLVTAGGEVSGIDIRIREDPGHTIAGKVVGAPKPSSELIGTVVGLIDVSTGAMQGRDVARDAEGGRSFSFSGVPNGEYEIAGTGGFGTDIIYATVPRRVVVKGADVTGIEIELKPLGAIAGAVLKRDVPDVVRRNCSEPAALIEETVITGQRDSKGQRARSLAAESMYIEAEAAPNERGEFRLLALEPGRYRLKFDLPSTDWYVKSVAMPGAGRNADPVDLARSGISVQAGAQVKGIAITLSEGAASLRGRVVASAEGATLPSRLEAHLLPAEPEYHDEVLRFAECVVGADGSFAMTNLAPGRYRLLVRLAREGGKDAPKQPLAWDATSRAKLRREAASSDISVELKPCERVADYSVIYSPTHGAK